MTVWNSNDNGYADLSSYDDWTNGAPLNTFARLRRDAPVSLTSFDQGKPYWSITRHEDILALNRQTDLLSSAHGIRIEEQNDEEVAARRTFQELDPPDHTKIRKLIAKAFSGPVVQQFDAQIRGMCTSILDRALATSDIEAVGAIARELPMRVLGKILGFPEEDLDWLVTRGDQLMANADEDFTSHVVDKVDTEAYRLMPFRSPAGAELFDYAAKLIDEGRTGGVLSLLLQPDEDGDVISRRDFQNFFCLAVAAGNDTTRYSIAAGLHALTQQPELLPQLHSGEGNIWDTVADECVRWCSPATYFRRTAMRDFELHGKNIKQGDKVVYWFVSGNRDEQAFTDPNRVNFLRSPNRHVGFGQGGPHVCIGMWLARLEIRILMQEFSKRVQSVELTDKIQFVRSNFVGGIKHLPLHIKLK